MVWLTDVFLIVLGEQWNYMTDKYVKSQKVRYGSAMT